MLALVEQLLESTARANSSKALVAVLGAAALQLGYRSAYVIEYTPDLGGIVKVIDSVVTRVEWWHDYFSRDLRDVKGAMELLGRGGVQYFDISRFTDPQDPLLALCRKADLVDTTAVPISHDGKIVGLGGFSGIRKLDSRQEMALQIFIYSFFSHMRGLAGAGLVMPSEQLTPREKQVISLSAEGLTSAEIAERLGLSARTVNQHVDNVAAKLHTKNRTHTVAEAIRLGLI